MKKHLLAARRGGVPGSLVPGGRRRRSRWTSSCSWTLPRACSRISRRSWTYVVSRIAREYLRFGDTFHLLTFTDAVRIEIAQVRAHRAGPEKPPGAPVLALSLRPEHGPRLRPVLLLYRYTADLAGIQPEADRHGNRRHAQPVSPRVPTRDWDAGPGTLPHRARPTSRIRANGWTIRIVRIPFDGTAGSAGTGACRDSRGTGTSEPQGASPGAGDYPTGRRHRPGGPGHGFHLRAAGRMPPAGAWRCPVLPSRATWAVRDTTSSFPLAIANPSDRDIRLELSGASRSADPTSLREKPCSRTCPRGSERTGQVAVSACRTAVEAGTGLPGGRAPGFADGVRVAPYRGNPVPGPVNVDPWPGYSGPTGTAGALPGRSWPQPCR
ncbi:MAG: hypothetical protein MZU97_12510 [Bacillus subtilis]|nr:hypothetical protein [Bacillus subtilis]